MANLWHVTNVMKDLSIGPIFRRNSMFRHFVWVQRPAERTVWYRYSIIQGYSITCRNGKSLLGKIRPIISQIENPKLLAYFRPIRTSHFLTHDWVILNYKRGCIFPMVIWPAFRMGQFRVKGHPYHAPQFRSDIWSKSHEFLSLIKAITEIIFDLAQFQTDHGEAALQKLMVKLGSSYRIGNKIEELADDLKKVSHENNIKLFLIRILGSIKPYQSGISKARTEISM